MCAQKRFLSVAIIILYMYVLFRIHAFIPDHECGVV